MDRKIGDKVLFSQVSDQFESSTSIEPEIQKIIANEYNVEDNSVFTFVAIEGVSEEKVFNSIRSAADRLNEDTEQQKISNAQVEDLIKMLRDNPIEALYDANDELDSNDFKL